MLKYLEDIINRFEDIRAGIDKNYKYWHNDGLPGEILEDINQMELINNDAERLRLSYMEKLAEARTIRNMMKLKLKILEKKIIGIHASEPERLKDYFI